MVAFPGGLQYAFLRDGGAKIFEDAREIALKNGGSVPEFSAHFTNAGNLPAKYVIHTVSVEFDEKRGVLYCNKEIIRESMKNILWESQKRKINSIGVPPLGTGLYRVPLYDSLDAMIGAVKELDSKTPSIKRLGFALYDQNSFAEAKKIFDWVFYGAFSGPS